MWGSSANCENIWGFAGVCGVYTEGTAAWKLTESGGGGGGRSTNNTTECPSG